MSTQFPPPDPNAAVSQPAYADTASTPAPRRRSKAPVAIGALVVAALVGGGAFAVASMSEDDDGASTPELAVDALFSAVGSEDLIGVLDTLAPGERESFTEGLTDMADQLERLGVLAEGTDLEALPGFDLEFSDMTYETEEIGPGVSTVVVTGGTVAGSYDLSELPLGDTLIDTVLGGERPEGTDDATPEDVGSGLRITTVEEDGEWYVSLWYSVAESARLAAGLEAPSFGRGVEASGAETPEGAVEALMEAAAALDLERVLALLPPDEMRVLHDYAPLFLPQAQEAVADIDFTSSLDEFTASADVDGNAADVSVETFAMTFTVDGETATMGYDGECFSAVIPGQEPQEMCNDELDRGEMLASMGLDGLVDGDAEAAIRVVRVDGEWYVSPTRSMFGVLTSGLAAVDEDAFRDLMARASSDPEGLVEEIMEGALSQSGLGGYGQRD